MANGKIVFTPRVNRAISLSGANWLSVDDAVFNLGLLSFSCNGLVYVAADTPDDEALIIGKGPADLGWHRGWQFFYSKTYQTVALRINDGQQYPTVYLAEENSCPLGTWFWFDLGIDRGGDPYARVNGAASGDAYAGFGEFGFGDLGYGGSADPADYAGSLDNEEPLRIGGYNGASQRFKGLIDFLRLDFDRVLPLVWSQEEWDRIQYGYPRDMFWFRANFLATWDFNTSLLDGAGLYELDYYGGGSAVFVSGWPYAVAPLELVFQHNYRYGHELGHVAQFDINRTVGGDLQSYAEVTPKSRFRLPFSALLPSQMQAFRAAYASGGALDLYLSSDFPPAGQVMIMEDPAMTSQPYYRNGRHLWEGQLVMEAV